MAGLGTWRFGTRGVTMEAVWWHAWSACSWSGVRAAGGHSPGASVSKERGPYVSSRNARPERTVTGAQAVRLRCALPPGDGMQFINGSLSDYFGPSGRL